MIDEPGFFSDHTRVARRRARARSWFESDGLIAFDLLRSYGALGAATLFGYTQALQNELLLAGFTQVPRQFVAMLPYLVTIIAVSGFVGRVRAPAAEGKVYETEGHA